MSDDALLPVAPRRIWPRIVGFLFLVALIGGSVYWLVKPQTATATALFEVRQERDSIVHDAVQRSTEDFEIHKKTQLAVLKSKFLLTAALRNPGVASLSILAGKRDKEEWLEDHLQVEFPQNGEILSISLTGSPPEDLEKLVDAVAQAYIKEVLAKETARKMNIRDMLERSLQNLQGEIKRKMEDYLDIAKGMGKSIDGNDVHLQLDLKRIERIDDELAQLERDKLKMEIGGDSKESKFVDARIAQLQKRQYELEKEVLKRNERSVDLETRGEEVKQLQQIANDLNVELEKMDIDSQVPAPIRQLQPATIESKQFAVW